MTDLPQWFNGGFDLTVQNLTAVFDDFTEARDSWRSGRSRMEPGTARRRSRLVGGALFRPAFLRISLCRVSGSSP